MTEATSLLQSAKALHFEKLTEETNNVLKYNSREQNRSYPNGNENLVTALREEVLPTKSNATMLVNCNYIMLFVNVL